MIENGRPVYDTARNLVGVWSDDKGVELNSIIGFRDKYYKIVDAGWEFITVIQIDNPKFKVGDLVRFYCKGFNTLHRGLVVQVRDCEIYTIIVLESITRKYDPESKLSYNELDIHENSLSPLD